MLEVQGLDSPDKQGFDRGKPLSLVPEAGKNGNHYGGDGPTQGRSFSRRVGKTKGRKGETLKLSP